VTSDNVAAKVTKARSTNRRVRSNVLSHARGISNLTVQVVLVDTVGGCRLANVTGAAGVQQLVVDAILLGVQEVGTGDTLAMCSLDDLTMALGGDFKEQHTTRDKT
jgi:hypothetical protein